MCKRLWEKVRGRAALKLESHCYSKFFEPVLTGLWIGSIRNFCSGRFGC
jgi:hypothetical protein